MSEPTKLLVLWRSADGESALHPALAYAHNSKRRGWWEEVLLLVWGPSARLLAQDEQLQDQVKTMMNDGVRVVACRACAEMLGVADQLEQVGVEVFYVGEFFSGLLKEGWVTLTF